MKKFSLSTIVVTLFVSTLSMAQPSAPTADELLKIANKQAAKENKNVFVMFHASWCGWCHKMDNSMNDDACKKYFDNSYVVCHLVVDEAKDKKNLENPGAAEMKIKYNGDGQGIPFWLILDKDGKLLSDSKMRKEGDGPDKGDNSGCPATVEEVDFFISVLKKTSSLSVEQEQIIRKRFRENDK